MLSSPNAWCGLWLLVLLSACAKSAAAPTACTLPTKMQLAASERINPDSAGEALPTVVRLYQLKEIVRVEESDFTAIWETPEESLGPDLVKVQEFTLFPGKSETVDVSLGPDTKYVVGVAIFRRPTGNQWRSVIPLPPSEQLCGAFQKEGAPDPAVVFRFDQYRVESKSRLRIGRGGAGAGGEHELPTDVAPEQESKEGQKP